MSDVVFELAGERYTARILSNGLARQHSVREIVDGSNKPLPESLVHFPFTIKLLPDEDFAVLPATSLTRENSPIILSLVAKLEEAEG